MIPHGLGSKASDFHHWNLFGLSVGINVGAVAKIGAPLDADVDRTAGFVNIRRR
jgi:hypothetical protein